MYNQIQRKVMSGGEQLGVAQVTFLLRRKTGAQEPSGQYGQLPSHFFDYPLSKSDIYPSTFADIENDFQSCLPNFKQFPTPLKRHFQSLLDCTQDKKSSYTFSTGAYAARVQRVHLHLLKNGNSCIALVLRRSRVIYNGEHNKPLVCFPMI